MFLGTLSIAGKKIERSFDFSLFSCPFLLIYIRTFDYRAFFKYNYGRNLKEVIFMCKFIEEFYYATLTHRHVARSRTRQYKNKWKS